MAYLSGKGLNLSGEQQTKTKTALEYFSAQLSEDPDGQEAVEPG